MHMNRFLGLFALVIATSLGFGEQARASFDYSTSLTGSGATNGAVITNTATGFTVTLGGTTVTLMNVARSGFFVPGTNSANFANISVTTTTGAPGASFSFNYTDAITLTNNPPPGTSGSTTLPFTGTITLSNVSTGSGTVTNAFTSQTSGTVIFGGISITGGIDGFASPTINGANGAISGTFSAMAVPEPASVALMGMGLAGIGGFNAYRRRRAA